MKKRLIKKAWMDMPPMPANVYQMEAPSQSNVLSNGLQLQFDEKSVSDTHEVIVSFTVKKQSAPAMKHIATIMAQLIAANNGIAAPGTWKLVSMNGNYATIWAKTKLSDDQVIDALKFHVTDIEIQ